MIPQIMTLATMIELSSWLRFGIIVENEGGVNLAKFTSELHARLEELLTKWKAQSIAMAGNQ